MAKRMTGRDASTGEAREPSAGQSRWLVDGMNVVGSRPDGWWRDRAAAMRGLVHELEGFAAASGESVTVVFDGRPFEMDEARAVEVAFAVGPGRGAADDEIAARVANDADPASLRVVTSDAELAERVREHRAEVVGAGGFRRRLEGLG
jgi:predicted RNA-binding protein with PIN domain